MNTHNSSVIVDALTMAAINRLKESLLSFDYKNANVEVKSDMLFVVFEEGTQPSDEFIKKVGEIFYWTDTLNVPHIDGLVHYYDITNTLLINLVHYEEICRICKKLNSFGVTLEGFDISFHEYTFTYSIPGRSNLQFNELMEIEQIVAPNETEDLEHLSVFRMNTIFTLTIKHVSWRI